MIIGVVSRSSQLPRPVLALDVVAMVTLLSVLPSSGSTVKVVCVPSFASVSASTRPGSGSLTVM